MPEGDVHVDAPQDASPEEVIDAMKRRARWIWQQLEEQRERRRHVLPREYVSGESHFYLGKRYLLKVIKNSNDAGSVRLWRGRLEVTVRLHDVHAVRQLLDDWYRHRAEEVFARCIADIAQRATWLKSTPDFRLRSMRTRWGSCSPKGVLLLNPQLIKAPRACIDYVISHELCHLKEHNHSAAYYRLLVTLMPDWEERKRELDGMAELLLNR